MTEPDARLLLDAIQSLDRARRAFRADLFDLALQSADYMLRKALQFGGWRVYRSASWQMEIEKDIGKPQ